MPDVPPRIYLAGPEVFLPDAVAIGRAKQALCTDAGFEGVYPLDAQLDLVGLPKMEAARRIALGNEALMRSCDLIVANLTPFRGVSMDSGTAFEIGFMRALAKPMFGYSNVPLDYRRRAEMFRALQRLPFDCDFDGCEIEDFDLAENLMITVAIPESGGAVVLRAAPAGREMAELGAFAECLAAARKVFDETAS
jgi:nucleoside 2-deoxyribosyltransferase